MIRFRIKLTPKKEKVTNNLWGDVPSPQGNSTQVRVPVRITNLNPQKHNITNTRPGQLTIIIPLIERKRCYPEFQ